jgi:hypothetical protein
MGFKEVCSLLQMLVPETLENFEEKKKTSKKPTIKNNRP